MLEVTAGVFLIVIGLIVLVIANAAIAIKWILGSIFGTIKKK